VRYLSTSQDRDATRFIGSVILCLLPTVLGAARPADAADRIENSSLQVQFHADTGTFDVRLKTGEPLLIAARARATTAEGVRSSTDAEYTRAVEAIAFQDALGAGNVLEARCADARKQVDLVLRLVLYDDRDQFSAELVCQNPAQDRPITVPGLEPISTGGGPDGELAWPEVRKILTNGKIYLDPGKVEELPAGEAIESWWNLCLCRGDRESALIIGYLDNDTGLGHIRVKRLSGNTKPARISLQIESELCKGFTLKPGAAISSGRVVFTLARDPFTGLESYAQAMSDVHQVHLAPAINGWCDWFYTFRYNSEEEVLRQARFAAQYLKPYGFEYIQIDDGYQRLYGQWEANERFPHGMKWLAARIRELGLKPGIWVAPYVIRQGCDVQRQHPEWLVHTLDGKIKQCRGGRLKDYALDITHPEAAEWMRHLFDTLAHDWGYDFIKIDFVDWTLLRADRYHDPTVSRAEAYRRGFEIMRQAVGPKRHLLDCGPAQTTVGLLDSTRIELDQQVPDWRQYFLEFNSTAPAVAKRYYFNNRTWINDPDHICLNLLSISQAQAAATIVALAGGNTISGDRMTDLDPIRLEILRKVLPSYGQAARPIDLFESDRPEVFALPVRKDFDHWLVLGLFNADEEKAKEKVVALDRLGLAPAKTYVAFDFWNQRLVGEIQGELKARVEPASVTLLAIHEKTGVPQVISTDRHISQGGIELQDVHWDAASGTLKGTSLGPIGSTHRVFVYLPEKRPPAQKPYFLFHDFKGYTLKLIAPHLLRIQVRFDTSDRVAWEFNERSFFAN
jgi:hypothetical protein